MITTEVLDSDEYDGEQFAGIESLTTDGQC